MKLETLKKVSLGHYPTPLEAMPRLSGQFGGGRVYIKRDDVTGPGLGGNKTRKLEYILAEVLEGGYSCVLTEGGPQTNHGRTTVAACARLGLKSVLVLSGEEPTQLSGNLTLDAMMGAELVFAGADRKKAIPGVIRRLEQQGERVYYLPTGGSTPLGAVGYVMAARELAEQCREQGIEQGHLVCAVGSLGTYAGLVAGARHFHAPFDVVGIPVEPEPEDFAEQAAELIGKVAAEYGLDADVTGEELRLEYGPAQAPFTGPGYNTPDPETRRALYTLAQTEGIFLDPTYTGKAFRGMLTLLEQGRLEGDVIFLHTGGAPALWAEEHLAAMQPELREQCRISRA